MSSNKHSKVIRIFGEVLKWSYIFYALVRANKGKEAVDDNQEVASIEDKTDDVIDNAQFDLNEKTAFVIEKQTKNANIENCDAADEDVKNKTSHLKTLLFSTRLSIGDRFIYAMLASNDQQPREEEVIQKKYFLDKRYNTPDTIYDEMMELVKIEYSENDKRLNSIKDKTKFLFGMEGLLIAIIIQYMGFLKLTSPWDIFAFTMPLMFLSSAMYFSLVIFKTNVSMSVESSAMSMVESERRKELYESYKISYIHNERSLDFLTDIYKLNHLFLVGSFLCTVELVLLIQMVKIISV